MGSVFDDEHGGSPVGRLIRARRSHHASNRFGHATTTVYREDDAHIAKIARYIARPVLAALLAVGAAFIAPAQASALTYTWSLRNQTSQSIYLEIYTQRGWPR